MLGLFVNTAVMRTQKIIKSVTYELVCYLSDTQMLGMNKL